VIDPAGPDAAGGRLGSFRTICLALATSNLKLFPKLASLYNRLPATDRRLPLSASVII
jgi:hypothetical protein